MTNVDDAELKLERAREHLNLINRKAVELIEGHLSHVTKRVENSRGQRWETAIWGAVPSPDRHFGVWLGDFVHNARSALDFCVYRAVREAGKDGGDHAEFPIYDNRDLWLKEIVNHVPGTRPSPLSGLAVGSEEFQVIEKAQPYSTLPKQDRPGHPLMKLPGMSNVDKHRQLHAAAVRTTSPEFTAVPEGFYRIVGVKLAPNHLKVETGAEIATYRLVPIRGASAIRGSEVKVRMSGLAHLAYGAKGKRPVAEGNDLEMIYQFVSTVVGVFRTLTHTPRTAS